MNALVLKIDGMGCGGCVAEVKHALSSLPGTQVKDVKIGGATIAVQPHVGSNDNDAAIAALARLGFAASPAETPY